MKGTRSEWSHANSTYYNQSEAGTVKTQLDTINKELEEEQKKVVTVISKQLEELEEVKTKREESET